MQRLQAAQREKAVERAADAADRVLQEPDLVGQLFGRGDRDAADHVGVAVQILRRRVHDDVGAELERPLHPRARERVVDDREDPALAREFRDVRDVDEPQRRIRRRFDPDQLRLRTHDLRERRGIERSAYVTSKFAVRLRTRSNRPERAAIEIVHRDDVTTGIEQLDQRAQ